MTEIDFFANDLLEEAKRFLEKSGDSSDTVAQKANLHAALMLSFCALEAHLNAIGDEFSSQTTLSPHEKGILLERDVRLEDGEFRLSKTLKITRLEDGVDFLHCKFSGTPPDRSSTTWRGRLAEAIDLRNKLTHARQVPPINEAAVQRALQSIIDTLDALYRAIYKRSFPSSNRGLNSRLTF